ncbi:hypothetical protein SAMN04488078_107518 [Antarctobacter heliothermus]|uniref:Uncharacterized protein n=1 Tax=Antarctobacter heliothermus TaxID=74033 RepID=A0A239L106_9RHOB|nr:hypothetical protein SAMN04488078_107518 [Antarctobacter heliothermus]
MSREIHNPLILLEASRRIELLYTDLQSGLFPKKINRALFQKMPEQTVNFARKFQTLN